MKSLTEYLNESLFDRSKVKFVHHVLDIMKDMADDKEKNFDIKFDEICGDLIGGLYHNSKSLEELEREGYLTKSSDGNYHILLTTTTHNNTVPCHISVDTDIVVENDTKMNEDTIRKKIKDAVEKLKKKTKLY